jgi:cobalt-zinc-cadmium efflux system outer membrane protein
MCDVLRWLALGAAILVLSWSWSAGAAPCARVSRTNVVTCALAASLERQAGDAAVRAANGRVQAAEPLLPSNPALELAGSRRQGPPGTVLNWSASLGVELEIAGQRAARRRAALAERDAQKSSNGAVDRAIAADALRLYFELLAAREQQRVLAEMDAAATRVWQAAQAAAERGAAAGIEADVADAARLATHQHRLEAARAERVATVSLASLLGLPSPATLEVSGSLEPLERASSVPRELLPPDSPETTALAAEQRAARARASAFRRARVPNPTVSLFAQRDGFDENVLGVGLQLRLPLPQPLGRSNAGEIAENEALAERASLLATRERRGSRAALARALAAYDAALEASRGFSAERVLRAQQTLANLASEVQAGRVPIRDAIIFQGPLLELQLAAIATKKELCLASVEVVRAAGLPLQGERP